MSSMLFCVLFSTCEVEVPFGILFLSYRSAFLVWWILKERQKIPDKLLISQNRSNWKKTNRQQKDRRIRNTNPTKKLEVILNLAHMKKLLQRPNLVPKVFLNLFTVDSCIRCLSTILSRCIFVKQKSLSINEFTKRLTWYELIT